MPVLNKSINVDKAKKGITNLRNKFTGFDQIINGMIKCTNDLGVTLLTKLFNVIMKSGKSPHPPPPTPTMDLWYD